METRGNARSERCGDQGGARLERRGGPASLCFHKRSDEKNLICAAVEGFRSPPWSFKGTEAFQHWMKSGEQVCL